MAKKYNRKNNREFKAKNFTSEIGVRSSGIIGDMTNKYANLNFSYYPGSPLLRDAVTDNKYMYGAVPTLLKATYVPTIGAYGNQGNTAVNQAVSQLFAKVRSVNAGSVNYSSADLMIFVMSMKSIWSYHAWMTRLLGLLNWYSSKDFNIPNEFYTAVDVDIDDLQKNRVNFAAYIDRFALNANTLSVPDVFPIIKDESRMCGNIYSLDESNNMGQYLIFEPEGFYRYVENVEAGSQFGTLQWTALTPNMDYDAIVAFGDQLINDVRSSEDHYIMCGDIRKAFDSNLVKLDSVSTDYKLEPVYNKDVLDALHNANVTPLSNIGAITQNGLTDEIFQSITASTTSENTFHSTVPFILDSVDWDPDPSKVVSLMRWMTVARMVESVLTIVANGPEIITSINTYYRDIDAVSGTPQFVSQKFDTFITIPASSIGASAVAAVATTLAKNASFRSLVGNHLPFQYIRDNNNSEKETLLGKPRCATIVTEDQILNVNRVKFYELFGIGEY